MIRCIAMDLDDTLLSSDLTISAKNQAAIRRAVQAGVKVLLASGRMVQSMKPYAQILGLDVPLIAYNGAIIQEATSGEIMYHRPVPSNLAIQLVPIFREKRIHLNAYLNDQLYMEELTERGKKYAANAGVMPYPVGNLIPLLQKDSPHKMLGIASVEELDPLQVFLQQKFPGTLFFTRSKPEYLEILAPEVSKADALREITSLWGMSQSEVMAIGDAPNDISMVGWAGVGVGIGNAVREVKEIATLVVADHDHDGVAEAILKVVFGEN
jgi:Cof subfamily protein (haloacid dehalogenase superfamily)